MWTLALLAVTPALAVEVFTVGSDDSNVAGADQAYKLNRYDVVQDALLVRFAHELAGEQAPFEIRFVLYHEFAPNNYELLWESDLVATAAAKDFYESPDINRTLFAGETYLLGFYMTNDDMTYYTGASGGDLGWANQPGVVFSANNSLASDTAETIDPLGDDTTPDQAYHQQVAVDLGADEDGDGVTSFADCDDTNPEVYPGHVEWCDGLDNDCNTLVDDDVVAETWLPDNDGDGFGDVNAPFDECDGTTPDNATKIGRDCDDGDADINPDAEEVCDGEDNNCDDEIDEGMDTANYWPDADGDGFGNGDMPVIEGCDESGVLALNDDDCDDLNAGVHPDADEVCDGLDDNCDGALGADEVDNDADGFMACDECNDSDPTIYVGAPELCDGTDHNCDGEIPEPGSCPSAEFLDEQLLIGSCEGCSSSGSPAGFGGLLGLTAFAIARRRR